MTHWIINLGKEPCNPLNYITMGGRVKELERMGFKQVYVPKGSFLNEHNFRKIQIVELKTLSEVINHIYN